MKTKKSLNVKGIEIVYLDQQGQHFISLTDIARFRNPVESDDIIKNWLRSRETIELLGYWEILHNPDFNPVEFDGIRNSAGTNSFTMTVNKVGSIDECYWNPFECRSLRRNICAQRHCV